MLRNLQIDLDNRLQQIHTIYAAAFKGGMQSSNQHPAQLLFYALAGEVDKLLKAIRDGTLKTEEELNRHFELLNDPTYRLVYVTNYILKNEKTILQNKSLAHYLKPCLSQGVIKCEQLVSMLDEPSWFGNGLIKSRKWDMLHELTKLYYIFAKQQFALKQAELQLHSSANPWQSDDLFNQSVAKFKSIHQSICQLIKGLQAKINDQTLRLIDSRAEQLVVYQSSVDLLFKRAKSINTLTRQPHFKVLAELLASRSRWLELGRKEALHKIYINIFAELERLKAEINKNLLKFDKESQEIFIDLLRLKAKFEKGQITLEHPELNYQACEVLFPELEEIKKKLLMLYDLLEFITQRMLQIDKYQKNQQIFAKLAEVMNSQSIEYAQIVTAVTRQSMNQSYNNQIWHKNTIEVMRASVGCKPELLDEIRKYLMLCQLRAAAQKDVRSNTIIFSDQYRRVSDAVSDLRTFIVQQVVQRVSDEQHPFYQAQIKKICAQELSRLGDLIAQLQSPQAKKDLSRIKQIEQDMQHEAAEQMSNRESEHDLLVDISPATTKTKEPDSHSSYSTYITLLK